jgi:hypothetical protein
MLRKALLWVLVAALVLSLVTAAVKLLAILVALVTGAVLLAWLFKARPPLFFALLLAAAAYVGLRVGPWVWAVLVLWALLELARWIMGRARSSKAVAAHEAGFAGRGHTDALGSRGGA